MVQFENTPKAFANFSPGLERKGIKFKYTLNPERVRRLGEPLQGFNSQVVTSPRVLAALEPWAEISERLRRIFQTEPVSEGEKVKQFWLVYMKFVMALMAIIFGGHIESVFGNDGVTSIFRPLAQPAQEIKETSVLVLAVCAVIFAVVAGLLVYAIVRFRHRAGDEASEPPQVYGSNQIELAWTVLPILIVFVLILVTSRTIADIQNRKPPPGAVQAIVVGHQWWWEIRYPELGIVTANELHVPASTGDKRQPTFLKLQSADVAHSFWVPQLAGKTDLIPNRENLMWIEPTKPGTYLGNCAEYCGTQHARMLIRVVVHSPEDFDRWAKEQAAAPIATNAIEGQKAFFANSCVNCHTIRGTSAQGKFGPDLTHLMSRETLGAGAVSNTPDNLRLWVRDPQKFKVGCLMPNMQLTDQEVDQITAYLQTLR